MPDHCNGLLIVNRKAVYETSFLGTEVVKVLQLDTLTVREKTFKTKPEQSTVHWSEGKQLLKTRLRTVINCMCNIIIIYTKATLQHTLKSVLSPSAEEYRRETTA